MYFPSVCWHFEAEDGHEDYALSEQEKASILLLYQQANVPFTVKEEAMEED